MKITRLPERDPKIDGSIFLLEIAIERAEFYSHAVKVAGDLIRSCKGGVYKTSVPPWSANHLIVMSIRAEDFLANSLGPMDLINCLLNIEEVGAKFYIPSTPQRESPKVPV
jgi:hypothetical protein